MTWQFWAIVAILLAYFVRRTCPDCLGMSVDRCTRSDCASGSRYLEWLRKAKADATDDENTPPTMANCRSVLKVGEDAADTGDIGRGSIAGMDVMAVLRKETENIGQPYWLQNSQFLYDGLKDPREIIADLDDDVLILEGGAVVTLPVPTVEDVGRTLEVFSQAYGQTTIQTSEGDNVACLFGQTSITFQAAMSPLSRDDDEQVIWTVIQTVERL